MPNTRPFLLFAFAFVAFLIWQAWQQDYAPKTATPGSSPATIAATTSTPTPSAASAATGEVPIPANPASSIPAAVSAPNAIPAAATGSAGQRIDVVTDVLHVVIDTRGGGLVQADLLGYPIDPKDKDKPFRLLSDSPAEFFVAQTGLISNVSPAPDSRALFSAEQSAFSMPAGSDTLEVPMTWQDASGIKVRKVYVFKRGSYLIESREEITNSANAPWTGSEYRQLQRVPPVVAGSGFAFNNPEKFAFAGAAWYSAQDKFQKLAFAKFADQPLNKPVSDGWIAMLQHYFFAAWIPVASEADQYSTAILTDTGTPRYLIRQVSPAVTVATGETKSIAARLYVGPKLQSTLDGIAPGLALTADYGMLTVIAEPLHWILVKLYSFVGNWGLAIILLVLLIKLALFKFSEAQYRSMAKMKRFQPRMEALKQRYGDDKQKLNAAMMELYKKEKINPLGGCLPTLVQIPVFFALYWVLQESVELRQAPFFGWIQNLSAPDPFFILPILNAAIMVAAQWLSPNPGMDPMQARMMKLMPLMFAVMFLFFPAGLVLYWTVNGGLSLLQQWIITKRLQSPEPAR